MSWTDFITTQTDALQKALARFPWLDETSLTKLQSDKTKFAKLIAKSHDLTLSEALDEIENWLLVQELKTRGVA